MCFFISWSYAPAFALLRHKSHRITPTPYSIEPLLDRRGQPLSTIDGETTSFEVSAAQATVNTETFEITADTETLSIIFRSGDFDEEITFQVTNPNSEVIIDTGPNPPVDIELLDYCSGF